MTRQRIALEVHGQVDALRLIWTLLEGVLAGVPSCREGEEERFPILVAVQELVTNIYRHAYRGDPTQPLRLEVELDGRRLVVTTVDFGPPFNPEHPPSLPSGGEGLAEGGYGLWILHTVMDRVLHRREEGANITTLIKDLAPVPAGTAAP